MSNNKKNKEQNKRIELTPEQQNPYLSRPEDFEVGDPNTPSDLAVPGHFQRGKNEQEQKQLLAERKATDKGVELPTEVDNASRPHQK